MHCRVRIRLSCRQMWAFVGAIPCYRSRDIKDVSITLSSLQQRTTHTHHPPTDTDTDSHTHQFAMCYNVNSFYIVPTCHCQHTTMVVAKPSSPIGTFVVPAAPVLILPPQPPPVTAQLYTSVVCITAFFRGCMC